MPHHPAIITAINNRDKYALEDYLAKPDTYGDINAVDEDGNTYLHIAAQKYLVPGHKGGNAYPCIELLLKARIDAKARNKQGKTAFETCDIDSYDGDLQHTPLLRAIEGNLTNFFTTLLNLGVDINKTSKEGCSPVCAAAAEGRVEMMQALIERGAIIYRDYATLQSYNPLGFALFVLCHDSEIDQEQAEKIKQCIEILFKKHLGILLTFNDEELKSFKLFNIILLGARAFKGITTIGEIKELFKQGKITQSEINEIIYACEQIKLDLTKTYNNNETSEHSKDEIEKQLSKLNKYITKLHKLLSKKNVEEVSELVGKTGIFRESDKRNIPAVVAESSPLVAAVKTTDIHNRTG